MSGIGAVPTWVDRTNGHMIRDVLGPAINGGGLLQSAARTESALAAMGEVITLYSIEAARSWVLADEFRGRLGNLCRRGAC